MKDFRISESIEAMQNQGPTSVTTEDLLTIILGNRKKAERLLHSLLIISTKKLRNKNAACHADCIRKHHEHKNNLSGNIYARHFDIAKPCHHKIINQRNQILNQKLRHHRNRNPQRRRIK